MTQRDPALQQSRARGRYPPYFGTPEGKAAPAGPGWSRSVCWAFTPASPHPVNRTQAVRIEPGLVSLWALRFVGDVEFGEDCGDVWLTVLG